MSADPTTARDGSDGAQDQFCSRCQEFMTYEGLQELRQTGSFLHLSYVDLSLNAQAKWPCSLCLSIYDEIKFLLHDSEPIRLEFEHRDDRKKEKSLSQRIFVRLSSGSSYSSLYLFANEDDPAASMTSRRSPLTNLASDESFDMARRWLRRCQTHHIGCPGNKAISSLPTYVIDVSPTSPTITARLYKPTDGEQAEYLCLSYCWGGVQQVTTTKASLGEYLLEIPVSNLGLTIQDAIETTRRLGFRYVWIDALCIVQDDLEQKAREIKKMSSIYKSATAVILAAVAPNSSHGFLRTDRNLDKLEDYPRRFQFQVKLPAGVSGNLTLVRDYIYREKLPLDYRAWALQEDLLAARKFVFSAAELLGECRNHVRRPVRESNISYLPLKFLNHSSNFLPAFTTWNWNTWAGMSNWYDLVEDYSSRSMTDPKDRLNAFQGVVDEVQGRSASRICYGIAEFSSSSLLWTTSRPAPNRLEAPSWSWGCLPDRHVRTTLRICNPTMRLPKGNEHTLALTARIIDGATLTDDPLGSDSKLFPDLEIGFPSPKDRYYVWFCGTEAFDYGLVLESANTGPNVYRRTGVFEHSLLRNDNWPSEPQEITLI